MPRHTYTDRENQIIIDNLDLAPRIFKDLLPGHTMDSIYHQRRFIADKIRAQEIEDIELDELVMKLQKTLNWLV
jgi:CRISPR/Cas system CSM-associated protein Csm2 small subunit